MKKSLIALGVAAGMFGVAHADTTNLYGALGFSMSVEDDGYSKASVGRTVKDNVWDLATHTSRFGIKGTEDLSNGLQAFFKFEIGVDAAGTAGANNTRYAHIGFKGDFGTVTLGRQNSLWKTVMDENNFKDAFTSAAEYKDVVNNKEVTVSPGRVGKAISYVSPSFGGFQFAGSAIFDADKTGSKGADAYEAAALYNNYGVNAGVVYTNVKNSKHDSDEYTGLNVGYKMDDTFSVNFGAAHRSSHGERYNLQGEYFLGANTFRAGVNYADNKKGSPDPLTAALGYQYNFSKRTYVWVEGEYTDFDQKGRDDGYRVFVGARHDF